MKKYVLTTVVVGLLATSASAGQLYMTFADGSTEVTLGPSDTVQINVYFAFDALDYNAKANSAVTSLNLRYDVYSNNPPATSPPGGAYPGVTMNHRNDKLFVESMTLHETSGWNSGATTGIGGDLDSFYSSAVDQSGVGVPAPSTPGTFLMYSFVIHDAIAVQETNYIAFTVNADGAGPLPQVKDGTADWRFRWYGYANQLQRDYKLGTGNPGDEHAPHTWHGYELAQPLIINNIPEPTSLALLALGGLAILRRR
jgi:hypothetical protein